MGKKNRFLIPNKKALSFSPDLATELGVNEAILIQQVHYYADIASDKGKENNNNYKDGYFWTYNSIRKWKKELFPYCSESTIKRAFNNLIERDLIVTANYNKLKIDRSKWYRVNYDKLKVSFPALFGQNEPIDNATLTESDQVKMNQPLPNNSLPNSTTNKKDIGSNSCREDFHSFIAGMDFNKESNGYLEVMKYFNDIYLEVMEKSHPSLKRETWLQQFTLLEEPIFDDHGRIHQVVEEDLYKMIDHYFTKEYSDSCNYALPHFNNEGIKKVNFFEAAWNQ